MISGRGYLLMAANALALTWRPPAAAISSGVPVLHDSYSAELYGLACTTRRAG